MKFMREINEAWRTRMNAADRFRVWLAWGFVFGAEIAGAKARERELFVATDGNGVSRRLDRTAVILSVAKRF